MRGFKICDGKGFHIGLRNGFTVSIQFGRGNYCEHHRNPNWGLPEEGSSYDAETAVFTPDGKSFVKVNGDEVQGWQSPEDVVRLLTAVARQKPTTTSIRIRKYRDEEEGG